MAKPNQLALGRRQVVDATTSVVFLQQLKKAVDSDAKITYTCETVANIAPVVKLVNTAVLEAVS